MSKITLATLKKLKRAGEPISMLTCYDYPSAVMLQRAGVDCLLVGDSAAQMLLGQPTTLQADLDIMVALAAAVRRGAPDAFLIGDMPFLSYQASVEDAVKNAGRFLREAGCDAVKMEVDSRFQEEVAAVARAGIPVVAHLGFHVQAAAQAETVVATRAADEALRLIGDLEAVEDAGASIILLECVTAEVAEIVASRTTLPVISCGSGIGCDGQVLVLNDVLGLPGSAPVRFSKPFGSVSEAFEQAVTAYIEQVKGRQFPDDEHAYHMKPTDLQEFRKQLEAFDAELLEHHCDPSVPETP